MKKYIKTVLKIFIGNGFLILIAFFYGLMGGSGGETTESVF